MGFRLGKAYIEEQVQVYGKPRYKFYKVRSLVYGLGFSLGFKIQGFRV